MAFRKAGGGRRLGGVCRTGGGGGWRVGSARSGRPAVPFDLQCKANGIEVPVAEHQFAKQDAGRLWRFDWAWIDRKLALEVEGGYAIQARCRCGELATCKKCNAPIQGGGRHTRASGYLEDLNKYNTAAILGWRLLKVPPKSIADGTAVRIVVQFFRRDDDRGLEAIDLLSDGALRFTAGAGGDMFGRRKW